jgi:hypothetical protein
MSDFWSALMALLVVAMPLGLAWALLGRNEHGNASGAMPRDPDNR